MFKSIFNKKILIFSLVILNIFLVTACSKPEDTKQIEVDKVDTKITDTGVNQDYLKVMTQEEFDSLYKDEEIKSYAKKFIGKKFPNINIKLPDSNEISTDSLKGSNYVIEFMGTWCPVCKSIKPQIEEFERLNPDKKIFTVGFSNTEEELKTFVEENGFTNPIHTMTTPQEEFDKAFELKFVPTFFFVDKEGIVQYIFIGDLNVKMLENMYLMSFGK